jgi:hypothetical protein
MVKHPIGSPVAGGLRGARISLVPHFAAKEPRTMPLVLRIEDSRRKEETMSLREDLADFREKSREKIPPDNLTVMDRALEDLERSGLAQTALNKGDTAPNFVLPNALGTSVSLSETLEKGPVVLSFYRGGW